MGKLIDAVRVRFGERVLDSHERLGDETVVVAPGDWLELARFLRDDPQMAFEFLMDLTAVDYMGKTPRFEVVGHVFSLAKRHRLRIKAAIDERNPRLSTLSGVWKAANWLEREAYDMFGIQFEGHPDLRRILMYPEFEGHPLRKDYPHNRRQPLIPERDPIENPWPARTMR